MSNFEFLKHHDELLLRLAQTAEACFVPDPNTTLIKMRQLGEAFAKTLAARLGLNAGPEVTQYDLLKELDYTLRLDRQIKDAFHTLRKLGNPAAHDITSSSHRDALKSLQVGHALSAWFHINFGGTKAKGFKLQAFIKPKDPSEKVRQLEEAFLELQKQHRSAEDRLAHAEELQQIEAQKAKAEKQRADEMTAESQVWEQVAAENEQELSAYKAKMDAANLAHQQLFAQLEQKQQAQQIRQIEKTRLPLNEDETRILIDEQLIEAGWEADTENLCYAKGARPIANTNRAIAEWPTASGPADYVLFMGLTPVAVIEAKKKSRNIYSAIDQAKRYSKGFLKKDACTIDTHYGEFKVPLTLATNGRPYLKQLEQESGIWFLDVRDNSNRRRALKGWYKPEEIKAYLR